jgi:hypothetical protein
MENELVKIEIHHLPYLYKFLWETLTISPSSIPEPRKNFFRLTVYPSILVLSIYKYSPTSIEREKELRNVLGIKPNQLEIISCGALSMFRPVEIQENSNIRINLDYHRYPDNIFRINSIQFNLSPIGATTEYRIDMETYFNTGWVDEEFKILRKLEGKRIQDYLKRIRLGTHDPLYFYESKLTIIGNILYPLYKGRYRSSIQIPELDKFANIIRNFGNTFNKTIENMAAFSKI